MSTLNKQMKGMKKAKETSPAGSEPVLSFDEFGRPIKEKKPIKKTPLMILGSISAVLGFLYIPALFKTPTVPLWDRSKADLNTEAIRDANTHFKAFPDEDFDGDGLSNSLEAQYNTNPFSPDSDGDGINDFWEIFTLNTDPRRWNGDLQDYVNEVDISNETATNAPYKIDNVVLWADDLYSKTYGGVVKTLDGYQFSDFSGWAQFTEGGYAYEYADGIHKALPYKEEENAFYINGSPRVILFDSPGQTVHKFEAFGHVEYLEDNFWTQLLDNILPGYGNYAFLKCYPVLDVDRIGEEREEAGDRENAIVPPSYRLTEARFAYNETDFDSLARVMSELNAGKTVAASLYTDGYGESIVLVYGYTSGGDLMIANPETLEPIGIISVEEQCSRRINNEGIISIEKWYEFRSIGHNSAKNWSRISFIFDGDGLGEEGESYTYENTDDKTAPPEDGGEEAEITEPAETDLPEETELEDEESPSETTDGDGNGDEEPQETTSGGEPEVSESADTTTVPEEDIPDNATEDPLRLTGETADTETPPEETEPSAATTTALETTDAATTTTAASAETEPPATTTALDFMNF